MRLSLRSASQAIAGKKQLLLAVKNLLGRTTAILLSRAIGEGSKQEVVFVLTWGWRLLLLSLVFRGLHVLRETLCCRVRFSSLYATRKLNTDLMKTDTELQESDGQQETDTEKHESSPVGDD